MSPKIISIFFLFLLASPFSEAQTIKKFIVCERKDSIQAVNSERYCFLVKEKKKDKWKSLCERIDSFEYQEGYRYKILTEISQVEILPSLPKETRYKLLKILKKKKTKFRVVSSLENKKWVFDSFYDGKTLFPSNDTSIYINFVTKGKKISGRSWCNSFSGNFTSEGNNLMIRDLVSTKAACEKLDLENTILSLLREVREFKLVANTLTLTTTDKQKTIIFIRQ